MIRRNLPTFAVACIFSTIAAFTSLAYSSGENLNLFEALAPWQSAKDFKPAPDGKASNWIKTVPGKSFFLVFRFYGPMEGYIKKTWVLNGPELLD